MNNIKKKFKFLGEEFLKELESCSVIRSIVVKEEIIREGQRIHHFPIVLKGSIKVYSICDNGKELTHYYLYSGDSCMIIFSSLFSNRISKINASAKEYSEILWIPVSKLLEWMVNYPLINSYFYHEYEKFNAVLLDTIRKSIFYTLGDRILDHLQQRIEIGNSHLIKTTHKEIADHLGTSREVVTRILNKYESQGMIVKNDQGIQILSRDN